MAVGVCGDGGGMYVGYGCPGRVEVKVTQLVRLMGKDLLVLRTICQKPRISVGRSKQRACDGRVMTCQQVNDACTPGP